MSVADSLEATDGQSALTLLPRRRVLRRDARGPNAPGATGEVFGGNRGPSRLISFCIAGRVGGLTVFGRFSPNSKLVHFVSEITLWARL